MVYYSQNENYRPHYFLKLMLSLADEKVCVGLHESDHVVPSGELANLTLERRNKFVLIYRLRQFV